MTKTFFFLFKCKAQINKKKPYNRILLIYLKPALDYYLYNTIKIIN